MSLFAKIQSLPTTDIFSKIVNSVILSKKVELSILVFCYWPILFRSFSWAYMPIFVALGYGGGVGGIGGFITRTFS